ncbi:bifunctional 3-(3-hydroxy-phenyl)propionate/3-hydroxycinnamic acid hydroxylase [Pseudomonas capeferrum]|uniref:bifunctional 3-(3-hydroxy-phenyl)propionate/3-hydroxycinnamic acid hydroxylase n=1 Tax=Pseudomonas capeferrum TaxID=1495066 RepID=UPI0015E3C4C9|nr:bifunctional 3-(3-hydroxy-phenyl)propionate/3-hydroxycinnamic acid hydroxylase [Pseudomonas capeferrum]MBA1203826.1 bifunctional 3-(3-hydroxy-phenyl)propionate/3-hydroxycinnamic acid hydroxylase [Pseudomonas capeferrum]
MSNKTQFDADIAIIGYGPGGVAAANVLGKLGVKTVAIERNKDIYSRARAVTVNDWTMRIFQGMGLAARMKEVMDVTHSLRWVDYEGRELTSMPFPSSEFGHPTSYAIYQPEMERILRDGAQRYESVSVKYGYETISLDQDGEGVTVSVKNLDTGDVETVRARYALACDGGASQIREQLGIKLIGDTLPVRWVVIDCRVKRWWPNRHMLTFWSDKKRPVVDIALSMGNHRWEFPLNPGETDADFQTHEQLWKLLNLLGVTENEVEIHQQAFYNHHVRFAERWREGRVILCGDAAHLMPPWAGSGMQSCIRDTQNVCLKLAEVLRGRLPESILDTYETERAPDVDRYTQLSVGMGMIIKRELSDEQIAAMMEAERTSGDLPAVLRPPHYQLGWLQKGEGSKDVVGKLLPQPRAANCRGKFSLLDDLAGDGIVFLGANIDPASKLNASQKAAWEELGARFIALRSVDQHAQTDSDLIDIDGELIAWLDKHGVDVVAVRPDKIVLAASGNLDVPALG